MPKCKSCKKFMRSDAENQMYICECGEQILWVSAKKQTKLMALYF